MSFIVKNGDVNDISDVLADSVYTIAGINKV